MSFQESVSFPIKAETPRTSDEEEAFLCSSRGVDSLEHQEESSTVSKNEASTNEALLNIFRDELNEMRRQNDELKRTVQNLSEDLEQIQKSNGVDYLKNDAVDSDKKGDKMRSLRRSTLIIDDDGEQNFSLPRDTFSLMIVSKPFSSPWLIGVLTYAIQMSLFLLLGVELFVSSKKEGGILTAFAGLPSTEVSIAQFLVLLAIFFLQSDLVEATRCLFVLEDRHIRH